MPHFIATLLRRRSTRSREQQEKEEEEEEDEEGSVSNFVWMCEHNHSAVLIFTLKSLARLAEESPVIR